MPDYNKAILMGRLTRDPDFRITPSGHPKTGTVITVNHDWIDQQTDENNNTVCFIDIEATGTADDKALLLKVVEDAKQQADISVDQLENKSQSLFGTDDIRALSDVQLKRIANTILAK